MDITLISIIGKPAAGYYNKAIYQLNNQLFETDFFFLPLLEFYKPQKFFLLGTQDSIWQTAREAIKRVGREFEEIKIPFGINEQEIWQIFETIVRLPLRNTRLIIDITHGFRAIPFAVFLAALYFQSVREDVEIVDILYGNYEARDKETGIAPVVHLKSFLDMHQWIRAARRFVQYGDGDLLIEKLRQSAPQMENIEEFLIEFQRFVNNVQLNFVTQIPTQAHRVLTCLTRETKMQLQKIPPYWLLHPLIIRRLKDLKKENLEWRRQWAISEWFFCNRQYSQAVIVLREVCITFVAEMLNVSMLAYEVREKQIGRLLTYLITSTNPANLQKLGLSPAQSERLNLALAGLRQILGNQLVEEWLTLMQHIQEARNLTGHALMRGRRDGGMIDPDEQIRYIQEWLYQCKRVLDAIEDQKQKVLPIFQELWQWLFQKTSRVFIIVNQGIHPIIDDLKRQFGERIITEIVTQGNIDLSEENTIVNRVKVIVTKHRGAEFVIVPSGLPYLITLVYNTVYQMTSKHPVYLQYDREHQRYVEKNLDPRQYLTAKNA